LHRFKPDERGYEIPCVYFTRNTLKVTRRYVCSVLLNRRWFCRSQAGGERMVFESVNTSVWTCGLVKVCPVILVASKSHHTKLPTLCNRTWWINWEFCWSIIALSKSLSVRWVETSFHCLTGVWYVFHLYVHREGANSQKYRASCSVCRVCELHLFSPSAVIVWNGTCRSKTFSRIFNVSIFTRHFLQLLHSAYVSLETTALSNRAYHLWADNTMSLLTP
jgi:hypothetical protein